MPKTEPASRAALRRASLLNLAIAALVLGLRLLAFALTRSTAILADAVEPVFNIAAAAVTGFGVLASRQPADELHPFGHRKLEFVVVGFHGAMVLGGAMVVALAGVWQLYAAVPVQPTTPALVLFLVSILANAYLGRRLLEIGERHGSPALRAAGRHARFDVLIALAVVVNLVVVGLSQWRWLDPLVSLVMVVVIGHGAVRLLRRAALGLMDTAPSAVREEADRLLQSALDGELIGYHDLRCRDAGGHTFVDFHLQFAEGVSLERAHDVSEQVEAAIERALGSADATAHLEPHSELRDNTAHGARPVSARELARRRAATLSLAVAVALVLVKFTAAALTGSTAVLSDALESLVNVVAATFAVFSVRLARSGTDPEHPYGHHKVEFLAAALEGAMIIVAAASILVAAVPRLAHPLASSHLGTGLGLLIAAALANAALGVYLIRTGRRLNSLTLEADGHHVLTDVWTSLGVLLGLLLVRLTGWHVLDPAVAILVACSILITGAHLIRRSLLGVMDTVAPETTQRAAATLDSHLSKGDLVGWHQLRIRDVGSHRFVEAHIQLPEGTSLTTAHEIADTVEKAIEEELAPASAIIHAEPASAVR